MDGWWKKMVQTHLINRSLLLKVEKNLFYDTNWQQTELLIVSLQTKNILHIITTKSI